MLKHEAIFRKAIEIRTFETFLLDLFASGKINGTVHTCVGQEMTPVILSQYLSVSDMVFSNHRGHGHYLAAGNCDKSLLREIMGSSDGVSGGIGGSQHVKTKNFISNGIQGGLAPVAVGWAYSQTIKKSEGIAVCFVGDGTLGEGQFYEALNLACMHKAPTLFVIEANRYAQSTPTSTTFKTPIYERLSGLGLEVFEGNIWDIDELDTVAERAVQNVRDLKPTILVVDCYRLNPHSKGDDNRSPEEIAHFKQEDPLNKFKEVESNFYDQVESEYYARLHSISSQQLERKFNRKNLIGERKLSSPRKLVRLDTSNIIKERMNAQLNKALDKLCEDGAILLGEDICDTTPLTPLQYGGAFKVTKGLSVKYPNQVLNAPIGEAGIAGFAIGVALSGTTGIAEIMFGDFTTLVVDQVLQQASKIPSMYGQRVDLPFILRTPMGGRRGYGPTHSQNLEKLFLHWPNINVVAINILSDVDKVYRSAVECREPFLIIEDKVLYAELFNYTLPKFYDVSISEEKFPIVVIKPSKLKSNTIIFCYGAMLQEILYCVDELLSEEIIPTIIAPEIISETLEIENIDFQSFQKL